MEQIQDLVRSDTFAEMVLRGAEALRKDRQLVDFTVIAEGTRFAAHKVILAASSDFFKAMFQHPESIESKTNECCLKDITPAALETILEFCYTGQIRLVLDKVQEILVAASILQIDALQSLCVGYIIERIDTTSCLTFLNLADRCNLPTLTESALDFCVERFDMISEQDEFLQLDASLLSKIISHDRLFVVDEEKVLDVLKTWIAADKDRAHELDNLVRHVRFVFFDPLSLINLTQDDQVLNSNKYREMIDEAKNYVILGSYPPELRSHMVGKRFEPRRSLRRQQCIFAVGGWIDGNETIDKVEKYDPYLDKWLEIKKMAQPRSNVGMLILDDCLYVVGGRSGHKSSSQLSSVECYNIKEDSWRCDVTEMKFQRMWVGFCTWRGYIYAIGGRGDNNDSLDVVERYDPQTNRWEDCAHLRQKRYGAGVTVCNDTIYVAGGWHGPTARDRVGLNTVERFNASTNEWSFVAPMTTSRGFFGCNSVGGRIYAVGGSDDSGYLETAECYDPVEDRWENIPPMSVKRGFLGLVETDGLLYAIGGGIDGRESLKLVETYDPSKKEWTTKTPMIYARDEGGFALYSNMKQQRPHA